ncbi:MAG: bifunctional phosphoribosylaminoimidazolecarboxamide formyltransferase/IMP cyclohydrolase [Bacteroidales bacterium]|nr:bifunctional phosphoribosylaminoimidazolecarboxamide formyltransferase/IMP cyclohydrolase [Bacteroidales bacterium]
MTDLKRIRTALVSAYSKDGLEKVIKKLDELSIKIVSTGGTQKFIADHGVPVESVESITGYPAILGGRVKTLHPKIFGGILFRRSEESDLQQTKEYDITGIDLVIVDLYPFEETVRSGASDEEIIEKIDIGGITLIRAAAKNFNDVLIVSSKDQYDGLLNLLNEKQGNSSLDDRKQYAAEAFHASSHYDVNIFNYFNGDKGDVFKSSIPGGSALRYGENPHQEGSFFGDFDEMFEKISGKEISYNNLLDIDAAVCLIRDFNTQTFAILKHNNACGLASRDNMPESWKDALAGDPISAFGGILITNSEVDEATAEEIDKLFFEVIIAPAFHEKALEILMQKKNRIILRIKEFDLPGKQFRSLLNGVVVQDRDTVTESAGELKTVTKREPDEDEINDLLFANKLVKHTKSNTIVLAKNGQLIASGVGQTSRVDALKQAIVKAKNFKFDLSGAVMASDAFFPFPDCVEIAHEAGIKAVIQPGGSIRDKDSVAFCDGHDMAMVFTGIRHFKH